MRSVPLIAICLSIQTAFGAEIREFNIRTLENGAYVHERGFKRSRRLDDIESHPQGEIRGQTKLVKIAEEVRRFAAEHGITEDAPIEEGLKQKSKGFTERGSEVYAKA
jgi:hypothetical protein